MNVCFFKDINKNLRRSIPHQEICFTLTFWKTRWTNFLLMDKLSLYFWKFCSCQHNQRLLSYKIQINYENSTAKSQLPHLTIIAQKWDNNLFLITPVLSRSLLPAFFFPQREKYTEFTILYYTLLETRNIPKTYRGSSG